MKFLCVGYFEPDKMDAHRKSEIDALMLECRQYLAELYQTGQVVMDAGLELETMNLRRANGGATASEGQSVPAAEKIGSVFVIEALNMDDAIRLAALHPTTRIDAGEQLGWRIEIRPIHHFRSFPSPTPDTDLNP